MFEGRDKKEKILSGQEEEEAAPDEVSDHGRKSIKSDVKKSTLNITQKR